MINPEEKILSVNDMKKVINNPNGNLKEKKFVFTNGCFDIIHAGHISYLSKAASLGDALIIGLNSDESVRRIKGEKRPLVKQEDRAYVLAGLECVDYVVYFNEDTPVELLSELQPHIHVKGGDYTIDDLPETPVVHGYGGEVAVLPFLEGRSTTDIVKLILDRYCN